MTPGEVQPEVLGTLAVAMHAMSAFTEPASACAFVVEALRALPGVRSATIAPIDGPPPAPEEEVLPIGTVHADFGTIRLTLGEGSAYAPYAPFARNLVGLLGAVLDNLDTHRRLAEANAALARFVAELEARVADRTAALQRTAEELRLADLVVRNATDGVVVTDKNARILLVNPAFTAVTGWTATEALGETPRLLQSGLHGPEFYRAMWRAIAQTGRWQGEIWNRKRDGEVYPEWLSITTVIDATGAHTGYLALFRDLTEQKRVERRIRHLAEHDALTDLPNRHRAHELLDVLMDAAKSEGRRVAAFLVDLDNFRGLNDSLGHGGGDVVLQVTADRLRDLLRRGGWVGRHGGDEFLVITSDLPDRHAVEGYAAQLADAVTRPIEVTADRSATVSASIGIAMTPEDGTDLDSLVRAADLALATAKDAGRNNWQFNLHHLEGAEADTLELVRLLRGAADRGELDVHYQPQVSLRTGRVVGVEALARWSSPTFGNVPPGRFIPLAERHGLIVTLGAWVLRRACATLATMPGRTPPISLAVNLSAFQFRRVDLVPHVKAVLEETGLDPARLELELTESVLLAQPAEVLERVRELKALGVRLSIDDFGTGYSSLAYLEQLEMDRLKNDRSFVATLASGRRAISESVIHLGHSLGLEVVAEGVEDVATHDVLRALGCDVGQGWYYGRPMTAEQLAALLTTARP